MRLRKEMSGKQPANKCVMYCGPSQQSVNVVMGKSYHSFYRLHTFIQHIPPRIMLLSDIFLQLLISPGVRKDDVSIIRVFSKAIEKTDFPGPELDGDAFSHFTSSAKCEQRHRNYSLHHIIRREDARIEVMERRFRALHHGDIIPSFQDVMEYRKLLSSAEEKVLKSGVHIILCTCNEAASHRITNNIEPKFCIVDECAMATEPECMVPIRRAEHVVLIGDHQQLQPVIQSREVENMGLGTSLFERYAAKHRDRIHVLEVQYRMVSKLSITAHQ